MSEEKVINPTSTYLAVYSEFESNLIQLEEQVKDAVVDLSTKQGIKDCKDAATKFQKVRTGVEKARKEETKEQREYINTVNEDAKKITERILPLENKFKAPLDERKQAFKDKLAEIDAMPSVHVNSSSSAIGEALAELESIEPNDFAEYKKDCEASLYTANDKLSDMLTSAIHKEEAERQAEEERIRQKEEAERQAALLAEQEKKAKIQERITNLQQIPLSLMGKASAEIKAKLDSLSEYTPTDEEFGDRLAEVQSMMEVTISQLDMMFNQASQLEEMQAKQQSGPTEEAISEPDEVEKAKSNFRPIAALAEEDEAMYTDCIADSPSNPIVEAAMAEVCTESKQAKAAEVMCELMAGELSIGLATEIVGLIDAGLIPYAKFDA